MYPFRFCLVRVVLPIASLCAVLTASGLAARPLPSGPAAVPVTRALSSPQTSPAVSVPSYVVTTASDDTGGVPANCTGAGTSSCSLRDALAASAAGGGIITFDKTVFASPTTIMLGGSGSLVLPSNTSVSGLTSGSGYTLTNLVTLSGVGIYDIFIVNKGATAAALANLTLTNGLPGTPNSVGAVVNHGGSLSLSNSTLSFNNSQNGAVFNGAGGTLTVTGCTFFGNGLGQGAAINNEGTLTLTNSTFNQNTSSNGGSGVLNSGTLTVMSSTFVENGLPDIASTGTLAITNTLLQGCSGAGCPDEFNKSGDIIPDDGGLLGNYGGPTQTVANAPGQPGVCEGIPTTLKTDQRGLPRSTTYGNQTCYDSGAVQGNYSLSFSTEPPASVPAGSNFAIGLQLEESGVLFGGGSAGLALGAGDNGVLSMTSVQLNNGTSSLNVSVPGIGDTLVVGLPLASPFAPTYPAPTTTLTAVSSPFNVTAANVVVTVTSENFSVDPNVVMPTFSVDGVSYIQPVTLTWTIGSTHTIATTSPQNANGCKTEVFSTWSDGGAIKHTVTAVGGTTSYQAAFIPVPSTPSVCLLTTAANPAAGGTVAPATKNYTYATNVNLTATPKSGYVFANWTGPVNDPSSASTTVSVYGGQTVTANFNALTTQTSYVVNSSADDAIGNPASCATAAGTCTLRDAVVGAGEAGEGNITFSPTVFAASQPMSARTISLMGLNAALILPSNTTVTGPTTGSGATLTQLVTVTPPPNDAAFKVNKGTVGAAISGLSISGADFAEGSASGAEAVSNDGILSISNSAMMGNATSFDDYESAAVFNDVDGTLTLTNCTIADNFAGSSTGGGIDNNGTLFVTGSTISGNTIDDNSGAGIGNGGTATLTNTIVTGNQIQFHNTGGRGGGIANGGTLNLVNSSVTGNSASLPGDGSGIYNTGTLHITNSSIVNNLTNYNQNYAYEGIPLVEDDCDGPGCPTEPIPAPPVFTPPSGTYGGFDAILSDTTPGSVFFFTADGSTPTTFSYLVGAGEMLGEPPFIFGPGVTTVKAIAFANGEASTVATATYTLTSGSACTLIDYSAGFTPASLSLNGGAAVKGSLLQLTDGGLYEARSAFYSTLVPVSEFTTDFQFQLLNPMADGITFTIQSAGPDALGQSGGGLGYAGIPKSVALKFDLYNNKGEGTDSSGFYLDGVYPDTPAVNLAPFGIYLHSGHVFAAHITFVGDMTKGTITDLATYQSYTASIPGDLTKVVGDNAYVGFTGGTGGLSATQNILTWTYGGGSGCGTPATP